MDFMIRTRSTGRPPDFARKLGVSQSHCFQILKLMKEEFEAPLFYSKTDQTYFYGENVRFVCEFKRDN